MKMAENVHMRLRSGRVVGTDNGSKSPNRKRTSCQSQRSDVQSRKNPSTLHSEAEKAETGGNQSNRYSTFRFYINYYKLLVTAFVLSLVVAFLFHNSFLVVWENTDRVKNYINGLTKLAERFPAQNARLWDIVRARGKAHLSNSSPLRPLIFMLVSPPDGHEVASCLATKLAAIIDPPNIDRPLIIDGHKYTSSQGETTKMELDNLLAENFRNGQKVAIIKQLEALPLTSSLLFHSYCDDQNAPYKDVAFIFTVLLTRFPDPSLAPKDTEGKVERYLADEVWKADENIVAGLLSRVADTVVFVNSENESVLAKVCHKTT